MTAHPSHSPLRDRLRARHRTLAWRTAASLDLDPADQTVVLDLAALAIARLAWRESPVEDWHAAPDSRISDAELMRANASITRHVRMLLDIGTGSAPALTHGTAPGIRPGPEARAPATRTDDTDALFDAVAATLTAPDRCLPDGRQLRELAPTPELLTAYGDHVQGLCRRWTTLADHAGTPTVLLLLADYAAVSCRRWWLGLDWPYLVTEFLARLEDPSRWGSPAMVAHVQGVASPSEASDLDDLHGLLLAGPDQMDAKTAGYCLRAGIGHLLPHDYHRPPRPRHILLNAVLPLVAPVAPGHPPAR